MCEGGLWGVGVKSTCLVHLWRPWCWWSHSTESARWFTLFTPKVWCVAIFVSGDWSPKSLRIRLFLLLRSQSRKRMRVFCSTGESLLLWSATIQGICSSPHWCWWNYFLLCRAWTRTSPLFPISNKVRDNRVASREKWKFRQRYMRLCVWPFKAVYWSFVWLAYS